MTSHVLIDIGNTLVKIRSGNKVQQFFLDEFSEALVPNKEKVWVSDVTSMNFFTHKDNINYASTQKNYKHLVNTYKPYESLGVDRWMALIAAYEITHTDNFVVIDIGTAVTIDIVQKNVFYGGLIMPGLNKLLTSFVFANNRDIKNKNFLENDTHACWNSGCYFLLLDSLNTRVSFIKKNINEDIQIFITGGGARNFMDEFDFKYSYYENLVLDGLELYAHNMG